MRATWRSGLVGLLCLVVALPVAAQAEPVGRVRVGDHEGLGRVVFDWSDRVAHHLERSGERLLIRFGNGLLPNLAGASRMPRHVAAVAIEGESVRIDIESGTQARVFRLGNRIVVDVSRANPGEGARQGNAPAPATTPTSQVTAPGQAPSPRPTASAGGSGTRSRPETPRGGASRAPVATPPALAQAAAPAAPVPERVPAVPSPDRAPVSEAAPADPLPASPAVPAQVPATEDATPAPTPVIAPPAPRVAQAVPPPNRAARPIPGRAAPMLLIPADRETGAAAFRRGGEILIVLDASAAPDISALRGNDAFGALTSEAVPGGVIMRLPIAAPARLDLTREAEGWVLALQRSGVDPPPARPVTAVVEDGPPPRVVLRAIRPGRVVALVDPLSGAPLLVATMRDAGQAMPLARAVPEARLLQTMLGAAILARTDHLVLSAQSDRVVLQGSAQEPLRLPAIPASAAPPDVSALRRVMDLPALDTAALLERLRLRHAETADAPPLGRGQARRDTAEALLALGLAQEAQAMVTLALREDPRARDNGRLWLVHGAASLAAGRAAEAAALDDPRLPEGEEAALWQALWRASQGRAAESGAALAAGTPLLLAYPRALRTRLLPAMAEALVAAEEWPALRQLAESEPDVPAIGLALARLAEAEGRVEEALAGYAALAAGRNRLSGARARRRAIELRLALGDLDATAAAPALDASLYAWRGDSEEVTARLRVAELRRATGAPRAAFDLLSETARLFPDRAEMLRPLIADALSDSIARETPLAAVTLHQAHGSLLSGAAAARAAATLAERLIALDLTDQASALLRHALDRTAGQDARAVIGARLADLRLSEGDARQALEVLDASEADALPRPLAEERARLAARAWVLAGDSARAAAILDQLGPAGAVALSELRAGQRDWGGAARALSGHLDAALPAAPAPIGADDQRDIVRLAAYFALAADAGGLVALRERYAARMDAGALAESVTLLTADPVRGAADLPRMARELDILRELPGRLEALRSAAAITR